jgi:DNA-binding MarR family transcriptional regulator
MKPRDPAPSSSSPATPTTPSDAPGRFAYEGLERAIHEKARLGIMTSLASHPRGLLFNDLKDLCHLTDGNLNRHLQVLHEEALIEIWKGAQKGRPHTLVRLTEEGRRRFLDYIATLEQVVADALAVARSLPGTAPLPSPTGAEGWSPA